MSALIRPRLARGTVFAAALAFSLCALASCGGGQGALSPASETSALLPAHSSSPAVFEGPARETHPPIAGGLPALPGSGMSAGPQRGVSYQQIIFNKGNGIYDSSTDTLFAGDTAVLRPGAGELKWVIYPFSTSGYQPDRVEVGLRNGIGSTAWVGISNYAKGAWEFYGPYTGSAVINLSSNSYVNGSNSMYLCVVAYDNSLVSVDYNLMAYDNGITPQFSISGTVTDENGEPVPGISVRENTTFHSGVTNQQGAYFFAVDTADTYTVTPDLGPTNYSSSTPANRMITVDGAETGADFSIKRVDISGTCLSTTSAPVAGVLLTLLPGGATATSGADGKFKFQAVADGAYTVTPTLAGYNFDPLSLPANVSGADVNGLDFEGTGGQPTFAITGNISQTGGGPAVEGVFISLTPGAKQVTTDANGNYSFVGLPNGTYTLTPTLGFWSFSPTVRQVNVSGSSVNNTDFDATPPPPTFKVYGSVQDSAFSNIGIPYCDLQLIRSSDNDVVSYIESDKNGDFESLPVPAGSYKLKVTSFTYVNIELGATVTNADLPLNVPTSFKSGKVTWDNFISSYVSEWCLQCHRPDSQTAVNPALRTYAEVTDHAGSVNGDIQADAMPPGVTNYPIYKAYWQSWITGGMPEN